MSLRAKEDIHINCFFFNKKNDKVVYRYKIVENVTDLKFPIQLFRHSPSGTSAWENLSTYPSIHDAVSVALKELLSDELADEVLHGQAMIDPQEVLDRVNHGERSISIFASTDSHRLGTDYDVIFEELIKRGRGRPARPSWSKNHNG